MRDGLGMRRATIARSFASMAKNMMSAMLRCNPASRRHGAEPAFDDRGSCYVALQNFDAGHRFRGVGPRRSHERLDGAIVARVSCNVAGGAFGDRLYETQSFAYGDVKSREAYRIGKAKRPQQPSLQTDLSELAGADAFRDHGFARKLSVDHRPC
jgi:hypothetical protein